jgi:uncharacterized membrane protein
MESSMLYLMQAPLAGQQLEAMQRGGHGGGFFLGWLFGGLMTAIWAALIVLLVLWIARNWSNPNNPLKGALRRAGNALQSGTTVSSPLQTPLEIVQTRYAKGEISREEYETMRRALMGEAPPVEEPPAPAPSQPATR